MLKFLVAIFSVIFVCETALCGYATIFVYHRFDDGRYPKTSISVESFEEQIKFLKKNGYRFVNVKTLYELSLKGSIPEKTVAITIDDGYRSTMKAFKVLKKYKVPFTVFLYTEAVGNYPDYLTVEELKELKKSGLAYFGSHLHSHPPLLKLRKKLSEKDYLSFLEREERLSRERFKKLVGYEPEFLALPYGDYDPLTLRFFRSKGYKLIFSLNRGSFSGNEFPVPRMVTVDGIKNLKRFKFDLKIEPLPVIAHYPRDGILKELPNEVYFDLEFPEKYKNCFVFLPNLRWKRAELVFNRILYRGKFPDFKGKAFIGAKCFNALTKRWAEYFFLVAR